MSYDSEISQMFRELKQERSVKKEKNKVSSTQRLIDAGITFKEKNFGLHLIIESPDGLLDFWPSTGLCYVRKDNKYFRGVRNLIKRCKSE